MPLDALSRPAAYNLTIVAGDSFSRSVTLKEQDGTPIDLTGYSALAQVRASASSDTVLATFTTAIDAPNGAVTLSLDTTQTRALGSGAVWDLQLSLDASPTTATHTVIGGQVTVLPDVSRV